MIARFIYFALFTMTWGLVKIVAPRTRVWARNSLLIGPIEFGRSDIDVSILIDNLEQKQRLDRIRWLFPLVKEINWYTREQFETLLVFINPVELRRDPQLINLSSNTAPSASPEERLVFLLRMYEACISQFNGERPWQRQKWASYFCLAGFQNGPTDPVAFGNALDSLGLQCGIQCAISPLLGKLAACKKEGRPDHLFLEEMSKREGVLISLFPHKFCFVKPDSLSEKIYPQILKAQLSWEFWGVLTHTAGALVSRDSDHLSKLAVWSEFVGFDTREDSLPPKISSALRARSES